MEGRRKYSLAALNWTMFSVSGFMGLYQAASQVVNTRICAGMGVGSSGMGLMLSLYFAAQVVSAPVMGELADRVGKKRVLCAMLGLVMAGCAALAAAPSFPFVCLGFFVTGFGFSGINAVQSGVISDENGAANAARVLGDGQAVYGLGTTLSPLLCALLPGSGGWRPIFWLVLPLFGLCLLNFLRMPFGGTVSYTGKKTAAFSLIRGDRVFVLCMVLMALAAATESVVYLWLEPYAREAGFTQSQTTLLLTLYWLVFIPGRIAAGRIRNTAALLTACCLGGGLLLAAMLLAPGVPAKFILMTGAALFIAPMWPGFFNFGALRHPRTSATAYGLMQVSSALGCTLIQPVIGLAAEKLSIAALFGVCAVLFGGCALLLQWIVRRGGGQTQSAGAAA